jgi:hypothetical protein
MNEKQLNLVGQKTNSSKSWIVGTALAVAAALAMTFALRNVPAAPAPDTASRPQLVAEAGVQSVLSYIALHSNDVARVQAVDPSVDSVARYIAIHAVKSQSVPEAGAQGIYGFLRAHGATINP